MPAARASLVVTLLALAACAGPSGPRFVAGDVPDPGPSACDAAAVDDASSLACGCGALPAGPLAAEAVPGAVAWEDLAFDADGALVGSDGTALFRTYAGSRARVWVAGLGNRAGLRFLPDGRLAVADDALGRILLVEPTGVWRTLVQGLSYPNGLAVGPDGRLYVTEHDGGRVLRVDPATGAVATVASGLDRPNGIAFSADGGRLYVSLFREGCIVAIDAPQSDAPGAPATWSCPAGEGALIDGLGVDACGNVYACDYARADIWRIPPSGRDPVRIVDGDPGQVYLPNLQWGAGAGWDASSIYVPDGLARGVWRIRVGVPAAR